MTATTFVETHQNRLFQGVPQSTIDEVHALIGEVAVGAEQVIFDEGDDADRVYLILGGTVRITRTGRGSQQHVLNYLKTGEFFGELEVLDRVPRSARATAAVAARVAYFDRDGFLDLLRRCPAAVTSNILRTTLDRIRDGNDRRVEELLRFERLGLVGEMASAIVHDLRNPLGVIRNVAALLEEGGGEFPAARLAGMLRRSADHMLGMIQDLLDFSRGTSSMSLRPVAVADLLTDLDEQALQGLQLRGTQVERRVSAEGELVADRGRLLRALLNIVKNAGEAMPNGGTLRVDVERQGGAVVFAISDTGGGIPDEVLARIFDPFVTHGKAAGTGLGLATAKAIVDAHRGRIDVESVVGKGTTFRVTIPCA